MIANLTETMFGPVELLKNFAKHALERRSLAIDAIVLITPGVAYSAEGSLPQHYLMPVYREGKTHLGDFVEPLLESWIDFEALELGQEPDVEIANQIDEKSKSARPNLRYRP